MSHVNKFLDVMFGPVDQINKVDEIVDMTTHQPTLQQDIENCSLEALLLIEKIIAFDKKYPAALEPEFLDELLVIENGAKKHIAPPGTRANWLQPEGSTVSHKDMHDRIFHHISRSFANYERNDYESGLDHLLHAICRAKMMYVRIKRGLKHSDDVHEGDDRFRMPNKYNPGVEL